MLHSAHEPTRYRPAAHHRDPGFGGEHREWRHRRRYFRGAGGAGCLHRPVRPAGISGLRHSHRSGCHLLRRGRQSNAYQWRTLWLYRSRLWATRRVYRRHASVAGQCTRMRRHHRRPGRRGREPVAPRVQGAGARCGDRRRHWWVRAGQPGRSRARRAPGRFCDRSEISSAVDFSGRRHGRDPSCEFCPNRGAQHPGPGPRPHPGSLCTYRHGGFAQCQRGG